MLWANLHVLFWLSLIPFATGCMGESHFAPAMAALYRAILRMASIACCVLPLVELIPDERIERTLAAAEP